MSETVLETYLRICGDDAPEIMSAAITRALGPLGERLPHQLDPNERDRAIRLARSSIQLFVRDDDVSQRLIQALETTFGPSAASPAPAGLSWSPPQPARPAGPDARLPTPDPTPTRDDRVSVSVERLEIRESNDIVTARSAAMRMVGEWNGSRVESVKLATCVSELARNIVFYAEHGEIVLEGVRHLHRRGLRVVARDQGPGIPDVSSVLTAGYRSDRGMGMGLRAVRDIVDEFDIQSRPGAGTTVTILKWLL